MPVEIIRRIQQERREKAEREELARKDLERRQQIQRDETARLQKKLQKEKEENRRRFVIQRTEKIIESSGVWSGLMRIDRELLEGNVAEHRISASLEGERMSLVWGKGFKIAHDGSIGSCGTDFAYSTVSVVIDPDKEILTITGEEQYVFDRHGWKNPQKVEETLAKAYIDPQRYIYHERYSSSSDSDSDGGGCCCCSGN